MEAARRRLLLHLLDYIEDRHASIDPDMYRIELRDVAALKELFSTDNDDEANSVSFTHDTLFALSVMLDAACTYSVRRDAAAIPGIVAAELEDLGRWVAACERWFITPLKVELLRFDPAIHRRITEVLSYLEDRAATIDPDLFHIDVEKIHTLQQLFRATREQRIAGDAPPSAAVVGFEDVCTLAYFTMAAREYSARRSETGMLDVTAAELDEMLTWLAEIEDRLRGQPN